MAKREASGAMIAEERRNEIRREGKHVFRVPSRTTKNTYLVDVENEFCTCKDRQLGGHICAHLYAAAAVMMELANEPEYVIERKHDSRLAGLYEGIIYRLVEYRDGERVAVVGERMSWYECYLDRIDLESRAA